MTAAPTTRDTADHAELAAIISDEEIARVHGHANFGPSITPREVVNEGVRKYAVGYHSGYTQLTILLEHGLITKPRPGRYDANLTKKGKNYARVLYRREADLLSEIAALRGERDRLKLAICGGEDVPGAIDAVTVDDCEGFIREERQRHDGLLAQAERQRDELRKALGKTASDFREVAEAHTQALDLLHLFDDHLGEDEPMWTDDSTVTGEWIGSDGIRHSLTFGMFRRVRAFLAPRGAE